MRRTVGEGFRLLPLADIHLGSEVLTMIPHGTLSPGTSTSNPSSLQQQQSGRECAVVYTDKRQSHRTCILTGGQRGAVGIVAPLDERNYRRLALLQSLLYVCVETACCLSPRNYRQLAVQQEHLQPMMEPRSGVLDIHLLHYYLSMDYGMQLELATACSTSIDIIIDNLNDIDISTNFF